MSKQWARGTPGFPATDTDPTPNFPLRLGVVLCRWRKDLGLTQAQLAQLTGVDQTYISKLERGIVNEGVNLARLYKITRALDKKLSDLFLIAEGDLQNDLDEARKAALRVLGIPEQ